MIACRLLHRKSVGVALQFDRKPSPYNKSALADYQVILHTQMKQFQSLEASLANLPPNIMNAIKVLPYSSKVITCRREKKPAEHT